MLKIAYLLESTGLCGGVKVVFRQAEALMKRGHFVTIVSGEDYPDWFEGKVGFEKRDPFDPSVADSFEWVIGTTPRLILHHYRNKKNRMKLLHLIQGYEPDLEECRPFKNIIDDAYSLPIPRITVSESMAEKFSRRYPDQRFISVGQGLEAEYFYPRSDTHVQLAPIDRIFLIGPLTISFKQIRVGLTAFKLVKDRKPHIKLIRISAVDTRCEEESLGLADEYLVHITPKAVGDALRSGNGILLSSSDSGEGFGLPALEAMACGVPVVLTDILSYRSFSSPCDYAEFAAHDSPEDLAAAAIKMIDDKVTRGHRIRRGLEVAGQFSYEHVAIALEGVFDLVSTATCSLSQ
ncbi:MAG: glycosyltransferase family 4 protein [Deltaproteobacteria bacterium]|nr:glycosyltransferase family 4 protein [Deltaproteobacteria bacterium]